ncbi:MULTISPECIES: DUF4383 domain-containing protein [Actinoalloteichus]|uniref:DUF4383 domain-containing protein n=1 Tax=Actinoalloteichus fjordicus TaxID=1612552 RepID=A0AAC9LHN0_9PSEU|nr:MULTISPECIES: DUF4383 domain-containing protein [Actinoalloteichus]APU16937.1 hypothetical protein UA74_24615 [Actinoalloteichus fjordicus]APU23017.1 hypothetical protein UA75_25195 [Actinoalloteichus sp. GBA129-24]
MRMNQYLPVGHPLNKIYRVGAGLIGAGLIVFGLLGFINRLTFFSIEGDRVLGLSSNGLLSLISVIVGVILIGSAVIGGVVASTTAVVIGLLFLLSGLVNLALLETPLNLLAFEMQNVVFSLVVGMLLLFLGLYGRLSGGLREDNPFVRARHHEDPSVDHSAEETAERRRLAEIQPIADAEYAVAQGTATPEQQRLVAADAQERAEIARREAYRRYEDEHAAGTVPAQEERKRQSSRRGSRGRHRRPPTIRA